MRMKMLLFIFTLIAAFGLVTIAVASPIGSENTAVLNASTFEPIDPGALSVSMFSDSIRLFRIESSGNELSALFSGFENNDKLTRTQTELNAMFLRPIEIDDKLIGANSFFSHGNGLITEIQTELNAMFLRLFEINDKLIEEDIFVNQCVNQQAIVNGAMTVQIDDLSGQLVFDAASGSLRWNHAGVNGVYLYVVTGQAADGSLTRSIRELVV